MSVGEQRHNYDNAKDYLTQLIIHRANLYIEIEVYVNWLNIMSGFLIRDYVLLRVLMGIPPFSPTPLGLDLSPMFSNVALSLLIV